MHFLRGEEYSNTRIFDRRKSEYSNSGSHCQLSPLPESNTNPLIPKLQRVLNVKDPVKKVMHAINRSDLIMFI